MRSLNTQALRILEQVTPTPTVENSLSDAEKLELIADRFGDIMRALGLDLRNDSLAETPKRVAKMFVCELFSGLDPRNFPKITAIQNDMNYNQMVIVRDVSFTSACEHHFVAFDGFATVAYVPRAKVIGLSKINRIVRYFARRPQVQERLTKQVADCLVAILETEDVAVHFTAQHLCVASRGVEDPSSMTTTTDLRGAFKADAKTRSEFLDQCRSQRALTTR